MNVGFIGLGRMGAGMAANLLKAGHRVTVFNRTPAKAEALVAQGANAAISIAEACQGDAVITMLANDEAVESVALGRDGIVANCRQELCMYRPAQSASHYRNSWHKSTPEGANVSLLRRCLAAPTLRRPANCL